MVGHSSHRPSVRILRTYLWSAGRCAKKWTRFSVVIRENHDEAFKQRYGKQVDNQAGTTEMHANEIREHILMHAMQIDNGFG